MYKAKIRLIALMCALCLMLSGCSPIVEKQDTVEQITAYATFYPIYALADQIVAGVPDFELHCLVEPQDECLRSYSLSDWDLYLLLYAADCVISGGSGLEAFSDDLEDLSEDYFTLIEAFYGLSFYEGDGSEGDDGVGGHFYGDNPHLYLSVDGAMDVAESIAASLSVLDATYVEIYDANLESLLQTLEEIKQEIQEQTEVCNDEKVVIMNEALIYPAQDYDMDVVGWVERESGEMLYDQSLENCLETLEESGAKVILIEQQAPQLLIETLEDEGYIVAKLDVLSAHGESEGSEIYFEVLLSNAQAAAEACTLAAETIMED